MDFLCLAELSEACLNNPRILCLCSTECKGCGGLKAAVCGVRPQQVCVPGIFKGQSLGCWSSSTFTCCWAEPWPGGRHHLPSLPSWSTKKKSLFLHCSRMRERTEQGQKWETHVAYFLTHIGSLGGIYLQMQFSLAQASLMSCLHAKAQIHHVFGNNANHQFPAREQSSADVGTRKQRARECPNRKAPRVRNPALCLHVLTLSNRSIAFSRCFLISVQKYFSCK